MKVEPYLNFEGRCEEAIAFYRKALGAEVLMMMRFKESPPPYKPSPGTEEKVMHATLKIGESMVMMSDGRMQGDSSFKGISLSINPPTIAEAERLFAALADGGQVHMPLSKTFWSPGFGMLADRFGVSWMISVHDGKLPE